MAVVLLSTSLVLGLGMGLTTLAVKGRSNPFEDEAGRINSNEASQVLSDVIKTSKASEKHFRVKMSDALKNLFAIKKASASMPHEESKKIKEKIASAANELKTRHEEEKAISNFTNRKEFEQDTVISQKLNNVLKELTSDSDWDASVEISKIQNIQQSIQNILINNTPQEIKETQLETPPEKKIIKENTSKMNEEASRTNLRNTAKKIYAGTASQVEKNQLKAVTKLNNKIQNIQTKMRVIAGEILKIRTPPPPPSGPMQIQFQPVNPIAVPIQVQIRGGTTEEVKVEEVDVGEMLEPLIQIHNDLKLELTQVYDTLELERSKQKHYLEGTEAKLNAAKNEIEKLEAQKQKNDKTIRERETQVNALDVKLTEINEKHAELTDLKQQTDDRLKDLLRQYEQQQNTLNTKENELLKSKENERLMIDQERKAREELETINLQFSQKHQQIADDLSTKIDKIQSEKDEETSSLKENARKEIERLRVEQEQKLKEREQQYTLNKQGLTSKLEVQIKDLEEAQRTRISTIEAEQNAKIRAEINALRRTTDMQRNALKNKRNEDILNLQTSISTIQLERDAGAEEIRRQQVEINVLKGEINQNNELLKTEREKNVEIQKSLSQMSELLEKITQEQIRTQEELKETKQQEKIVREELEKIKQQANSNKQQLVADIANKITTIGGKDSEILELEQKFKKLDEVQKQEISELQASISTLQSKQDAQTAKRDEQQGKINTLEREIYEKNLFLQEEQDKMKHIEKLNPGGVDTIKLEGENTKLKQEIDILRKKIDQFETKNSVFSGKSEYLHSLVSQDRKDGKMVSSTLLKIFLQNFQKILDPRLVIKIARYYKYDMKYGGVNPEDAKFDFKNISIACAHALSVVTDFTDYISSSSSDNNPFNFLFEHSLMRDLDFYNSVYPTTHSPLTFLSSDWIRGILFTTKFFKPDPPKEYAWTSLETTRSASHKSPTPSHKQTAYQHWQIDQYHLKQRDSSSAMVKNDSAGIFARITSATGGKLKIKRNGGYIDVGITRDKSKPFPSTLSPVRTVVDLLMRAKIRGSKVLTIPMVLSYFEGKNFFEDYDITTMDDRVKSILEKIKQLYDSKELEYLMRLFDFKENDDPPKGDLQEVEVSTLVEYIYNRLKLEEQTNDEGGPLVPIKETNVLTKAFNELGLSETPKRSSQALERVGLKGSASSVTVPEVPASDTSASEALGQALASRVLDTKLE